MSQLYRARRLALQCLCCLDVRGDGVAELVDQFVGDSQEPAATLEMARRLLHETHSHRERLDQLLARHARHWQLHRLAVVDRSILRLAAGEILSGKTPLKVAISEALHLAREFSTAESPRFINGVLDAIAKEILQDRAADSAGGGG